MNKAPYSHFERVADPDPDSGPVTLSPKALSNCGGTREHAMAVLRLARYLGVDTAETLVMPAPLLSFLCGRRMFYLRGWRRYESCVKGFNALGLLAEHAIIEERKLEKLSKAALRRDKRRFLASRGVFSKRELAAISKDELDGLDAMPLALWHAFSQRTIFCATSANLGICLHQALRDMRRKELAVAGKRFPLLGKDEGRLVIWCPDERADFMSTEKSFFLRALAVEKPKLTTLKPYVNRQSRDPGALKDALESGGYFFPTNPQSRSELKNLLTLALRDLAGKRGISISKLLANPAVRRALDSLGADVARVRLSVRSSLEGGMLGMAVPYLVMLEETLRRGDTRALAVWNPASIGAALAALVLCDEAAPELRRGTQTRIHGVFDIANLQSLAQLFGVPVRRHQSGRQTAYVGLGSGSYANGNLCFEILRRSARGKGPFRGESHLHPATHTLNPIARALAYSEDLHRVASAPGFSLKDLRGLRKPEPAGAAALAGYLLARLDSGTLSFIEIAYALRLGGFTKATFLEFSGFGDDEAAADRYIQLSGEEGSHMEALARGLLQAMGRSPARLTQAARAERRRSRRNYASNPLDDPAFEAKDPAVNIHLTGDNCAQPSPELVARLYRSYRRARVNQPKPSAQKAVRWRHRFRDGYSCSGYIPIAPPGHFSAKGTRSRGRRS